jgi:hypothetical protein
MVVRSRRLRPVVIAGVGAAAVFVAFVAAGFWWLDGLNATRGFYTEGVSQYRPYGYFVFFGNPAALALCVGPFVGVGLVTSARSAALRTSSPMLLAGAAFVAAVAANLTGLSNAETERIWLPFMPWLAVAAGAATWPTRGSRVVLGVSLALGLVIQATLVTPW